MCACVYKYALCIFSQALITSSWYKSHVAAPKFVCVCMFMWFMRAQICMTWVLKGEGDL